MNLVQLSGPSALGGKIVGCTCKPDGTCEFVQAAAGLGHPGKIVGMVCDDDGRNCRMVQAAAGLGQHEKAPSVQRQMWGVVGLSMVYGAGLGVLGSLFNLASVWIEADSQSQRAADAVSEGSEWSYIVINLLAGAVGGVMLSPLAGIAFMSGKRVARKEAATIDLFPEAA